MKFIAPFVALIHSIDSFKLLQEVNKQGAKINRKIKVLLQFHIAEEESKFGLSIEDEKVFLGNKEFALLQNIEICGVMGMATFTNNEIQIKKEFNHLKTIFNSLQRKYFAEQKSFKEISMGMTSDYPLAIECGSTMLRIASAIFGNR